MSTYVKEYLTEGESILAEYGLHTRKGGKYCATNKRLIHIRKKIIGIEFSDLVYRNINSVRQNTGISKMALLIGIIFFIFSGIIAEQSSGIASIFSLAGIVTLGLGLFYFRDVKYRFISPGLSETDLKLWEINIPFWQVTSKEQANDFAKIVRQKLLDFQ